MPQIDPKWFQNIKAEIINKTPQRIFTVSGEGKVTAHSDTAILSFTLITQGQTVRQVIDKNKQQINLIFSAVKKIQLKNKNISTSKYSLYPNYSYHKEKPPKITNYTLEQEVVIKVKQLELLDELLDILAKDKVNKIMLVFDIDDTSSFKKEAREMAFKDAQKKAQEMAKAAGVRLGQVVTFSENEDENYSTHSIPASQIGFSDVKGRLSGPVSVVDSGSKEFNANINVTYEIE